MSLTFFTALLASSGGAGIITFLFTRSKYKVDVENTAIENDIKLSNHYRGMLDDLEKRYEKKYIEFEQIMQRKVQILEEENQLKDRKIRLLEREITELKRENKQLKNGKNSPT